MNRRQFVQAGALSISTQVVLGQNRGFVPGTCDILVYGATPAGIAAAIAAARTGAFVVIVEPTMHFGGMVTGGMSNTDFKTFESVHGIYREFMHRIVGWYRQRYGSGSVQEKECFHGARYEPSVAASVFKEMLQEAGVRYWLGQRVMRVNRREGSTGNSIASAVLANDDDGVERETAASVYIDATYEGDLMAAAGCQYRVGRESRSEYGELFAGVTYFDNGKFLHGSTGEGDERIQCYNFRLCMTDVPANRVAIPKPSAYEKAAFSPLLDAFESGRVKRVMGGIFGLNRIPNGKADVNDLMYSPFSLRLPGENYNWPDGDTITRRRVFERHKQHTLGLWWFLQNEATVPTAIREEAQQWGFAKDEFADTGNFPPILYVREGRRLKSQVVLTERDTQRAPGSARAPLHQDAVAVCDYSLDSHGNAPPGPLHPGITEGVFNWYVVPYQIPYGVMMPNEVSNLLVPVAVSASHVAYCSLRMEPTWTALGQAAGIAAAQALREKQSVAELDVRALQDALHTANAITVYLSDVEPGSPYFRAAQYFGTRGLFHELPENRGAPYVGRGKSILGQWLEAYPQHEVRPGEAITPELAARWSRAAGLSETPPFQGRNRGDYLNLLLTKVSG